MKLNRSIAIGCAMFAAVMLASCQHTATQQRPWADEQQAFAQPPDLTKRPAVQYLPVNFYLAQNTQALGLSRLQTGNDVLWFLPQAVLTRADLENVEPRRNTDGQPFVRMKFSPSGTAKLDEITTRYQGAILITTVGQNIVGLLRLDTSTQDGILDILARTDQEAVNIANAVSQPLN